MGETGSITLRRTNEWATENRRTICKKARAYSIVRRWCGSSTQCQKGNGSQSPERSGELHCRTRDSVELEGLTKLFEESVAMRRISEYTAEFIYLFCALRITLDWAHGADNPGKREDTRSVFNIVQVCRS